MVSEQSKLISQGLQGDELKKKMDDAVKRLEEKLQDSGYKYLCIANPANGEEFFKMLFERDWSDKTMVGITRDKLYSLCSAKITMERYNSSLFINLFVSLKFPSHFNIIVILI